jgi:hypothetical protein
METKKGVTYCVVEGRLGVSLNWRMFGAGASHMFFRRMTCFNFFLASPHDRAGDEMFMLLRVSPL